MHCSIDIEREKMADAVPQISVPVETVDAAAALRNRNRFFA